MPFIHDVTTASHSHRTQVYSEFRLPAHPLLTPLITEYAQGTDEKTSLGPHWQRPGRTILERLLVDVPEPRDVLGETGQISNLDRVYFTGKLSYVYALSFYTHLFSSSSPSSPT